MHKQLKQPQGDELLVRFKRRTYLGRDPRTGQDVVAQPGEVHDLKKLESLGVFMARGGSPMRAEALARELCVSWHVPPRHVIRGELVNERDRARVVSYRR